MLPSMQAVCGGNAGSEARIVIDVDLLCEHCTMLFVGLLGSPRDSWPRSCKSFQVDCEKTAPYVADCHRSVHAGTASEEFTDVKAPSLTQPLPKCTFPSSHHTTKDLHPGDGEVEGSGGEKIWNNPLVCEESAVL